MSRRTLLMHTALTHGIAGAIISLPLIVVKTLFVHLPGNCAHFWAATLGGWAVATGAAALLPALLTALLPGPLQRAGLRSAASVLGTALAAGVGFLALDGLHAMLHGGAALAAMGMPEDALFSLAMGMMLCTFSLVPWSAAEWLSKQGGSTPRPIRDDRTGALGPTPPTGMDLSMA